jgi:hypothetical protein
MSCAHTYPTGVSDVDAHAENFESQTPNPHSAARNRDSGEGRWRSMPETSPEKKFSLWDLYPISLWDLYPPRREATGLRHRDDGGAVNNRAASDLDIDEKK